MKYKLTVKVRERILIKDIELDFSNGDICVLGYHGCGKTLLLKSLQKLNKKFKYYFLEKSNYECECPFSFAKNKIPYVKGLMKKIDSHPEVLVIDDLSAVFDEDERVKIFDYIKSLGIRVLYCTSDVEDIICFSYVIVLYDKCIAMEGKTIAILKEEKLMKLLGYSLPFYVNLSIQLKYYGLVNHLCYNAKELEDCLWS